MTYQHKQTGYLMIYILLGIGILFGISITQSGYNLPMLLSMLIVFGIVLSFVSLTVCIDEHFLKIQFGYGLFKKNFPLKEITSVTEVKNHWYYGYGIRMWFWPRMWIYNVSGFDAVEIMIKKGKRYRIGTDEPQKLAEALRNSISK